MNPFLVKAATHLVATEGARAAKKYGPKVAVAVIAGVLALCLAVGGLVAVFITPWLSGGDDESASTGAGTGICQVAAPQPVLTGGTRSTKDLGSGWEQNTQAILGVVAQRVPGPARTQAGVVALATAMQESRLYNNPGGDRDSVGLFQQRPSMGWGTVAQLMDPAYATGRFLDALLDPRNKGWETMPVTVAAQRVQRSGHPTLYAQWEGLARQLVGGTATTGSAGGACVGGAPGDFASLPGCTVTGDLSHFPNGQIPDAALCALPSAPGQKLRSDAAAAFAALNAAYRQAFGSDISVTDSYRSLPEQIDVYRRKPGLAAKPGTSKHGLGQALDLGSGINNANSTTHAWMDQNAARYGWINPAWAQQRSGQFEPWHWEYQGGTTPKGNPA